MYSNAKSAKEHFFYFALMQSSRRRRADREQKSRKMIAHPQNRPPHPRIFSGAALFASQDCSL